MTTGLTARERAVLHRLVTAWTADDSARLRRRVDRAMATLPPESQRRVLGVFVGRVDGWLARQAARGAVAVPVFPNSLEPLRRLAQGEE